MHDYKKLRIRQQSIEIVKEIYEVTKNFPSEEKFGLTNQIRRSAVSVPSNIAEGAGGSNAMFKRYLNITKGSIRECIVCSTVAYRRKYISEAVQKKSRIKLTELSKMTSGLIKSIT